MEVKSISSTSLITPVKLISLIPPIQISSHPHLGFLHQQRRCCPLRARGKKTSNSEPLLRPSLVQEVSSDNDEKDDEDGLDFDEFEEDILMEGEDDYVEDGEFEDEFLEEEEDGEFEDEFLEEEDEEELRVGDGGGGGGIALAGTWWDEEALAIAEATCRSFGGEFGIYAFRTLPNSTIRVRIESLTNGSGFPDLNDLEAFSTTYRALLDEAERAKTIPEDIALEVSCPGIERIIRIPEDLNRFKERPMFVRYVKEEDSLSEWDGVFRLVSLDMESRSCTWGWADVRINREKAGKGRPLTKKLKDWRLETPFSSLRLVQLYCEP